MASIVSYGQSVNASAAETMAVRDIAFNESSLNVNDGPSSAGAIGPFQYKPDTWNSLYPGLNINSPTDQIKAAFEEVANSDAMYYPLSTSNPSVYDIYSLSDYADAIHIFSLGTNTQPTLSQLQTAHTKMTAALSALGFLGLFTKSATLQLNEAGRGAGIGYGNLVLGGFSGFGSYQNPGVEVIIEDSTYTDEYGNTYILNGSGYQGIQA